MITYTTATTKVCKRFGDIFFLRYVFHFFNCRYVNIVVFPTNLGFSFNIYTRENIWNMHRSILNLANHRLVPRCQLRPEKARRFDINRKKKININLSRRGQIIEWGRGVWSNIKLLRGQIVLLIGMLFYIDATFSHSKHILPYSINALMEDFGYGWRATRRPKYYS